MPSIQWRERPASAPSAPWRTPPHPMGTSPPGCARAGADTVSSRSPDGSSVNEITFRRPHGRSADDSRAVWAKDVLDREGKELGDGERQRKAGIVLAGFDRVDRLP